jgi:hypothetical protein
MVADAVGCLHGGLSCNMQNATGVIERQERRRDRMTTSTGDAPAEINSPHGWHE